MRSVKEWVGKTDDSRPPDRVRMRIFEEHKGRCACCHRKIRPGDKWILDHVIAIENGGKNEESNLWPMLREHHKSKTKQDAAIKRHGTKVRKRHLGLKKTARSFRTNKDQPFKKKIDGTVVPREKAGQTPLGGPARRHGEVVAATQAGVSPSPAPPWRSFSMLTEHLLIVRMRGPCIAHLAALNNREHMRYSEQRLKIHTYQTQATEIHNSIISEKTDTPRLYFYLFGKVNVIVGSMSADLDLNNKRVDMGIMVLPEHAGRGYGAEAWRAMMGYWLDPERGGMRKVEAGMMEANIAMIRICANARMTAEGIRLQHFMVDGHPVAAVLYGKLAP